MIRPHASASTTAWSSVEARVFFMDSTGTSIGVTVQASRVYHFVRVPGMCLHRGVTTSSAPLEPRQCRATEPCSQHPISSSALSSKYAGRPWTRYQTGNSVEQSPWCSWCLRARCVTSVIVNTLICASTCSAAVSVAGSRSTPYVVLSSTGKAPDCRAESGIFRTDVTGHSTDHPAAMHALSGPQSSCRHSNDGMPWENRRSTLTLSPRHANCPDRTTPARYAGRAR